MPANGTLCLGGTCLQTRCSAKESGHSLEFNGPLQIREHSLPVIRRKKGLWTDSAVNRNFTPFCCTITFMHMRCTEQVWSYSLEFCPGGLYKNKLWACLLAQLLFFLWPECVCLLYVLYLVLCHFTHNLQKSPTLSSGHSTGKGQFSFQSQRKSVPENAQTTAQLHSSHMLVK